MRVFKKFACIDWSGQAAVRTRGIALATCGQGTAAPTLVEPERGWSRAEVLDWLSVQGRETTDMLIGLDLSPALPFADAGGYFPGWPMRRMTPATCGGWSTIDASTIHISARTA